MLRRVAVFMFAMFLGAGLMYGAFSLHIVRANDGWHVIRKSDPHLSELYSDVRSWGVTQWRSHPQLIRSLSAAGKGKLVVGSAIDLGISEALNRLDRR